MSESTNNPQRDVVTRVLGVLDHILDTLHDRVLRPLTITGRFVAFGFLLFLAAVVVVIALLIGVVRLLDVYAFSAHRWITYFVVGSVLVSGGLYVWGRTRPSTAKK